MSNTIKTCHCGKTYKSEGFFKKHVESCRLKVQPDTVQPDTVQPDTVQPDTVQPKAQNKPRDGKKYSVYAEDVSKPESFMNEMEQPHKGIISDNILQATDNIVPQRTENMPEFEPEAPNPNEDIGRRMKRMEELIMTLLFTYNRARMLNEQLMMENDYFRTLFGIPKITISKGPPPNDDDSK